LIALRVSISNADAMDELEYLLIFGCYFIVESNLVRAMLQSAIR